MISCKLTVLIIFHDISALASSQNATAIDVYCM